MIQYCFMFDVIFAVAIRLDINKLYRHGDICYFLLYLEIKQMCSLFSFVDKSDARVQTCYILWKKNVE